MCKISDGWIADIPNWTVLKRIYEFFFVILSPYAFPSFNNICRPLTPFNHLCVLLVHFCSAFLLCKKKTQKVLVVMVAFVWTMLLLLLSLVASTFNITLRVCEQSETIFQLKLTFFFVFFLCSDKIIGANMNYQWRTILMLKGKREECIFVQDPNISWFQCFFAWSRKVLYYFPFIILQVRETVKNKCSTN